MPDADEYRTAIMRSPEMLPGGINIFNGIIDDSTNDHGETVSFYVSGADQQGNALARGGGPVCDDTPASCGGGGAPADWSAALSHDSQELPANACSGMIFSHEIRVMDIRAGSGKQANLPAIEFSGLVFCTTDRRGGSNDLRSGSGMIQKHVNASFIEGRYCSKWPGDQVKFVLNHEIWRFCCC